MKKQLVTLAVLTAFFAGTATAGDVTGLTTFESNTKALAAEVNGNFNVVKTAVDDNQAQITAVKTTADANTIAIGELAPAVPGSTVGDMQYWDGTAWVLLAAPTGAEIVTLRFCNGQPKWEGCTYAIGDTGPGGGTVFYITEGGLHGLEAALTDSAISEWGCKDISVGGTATNIGSGATNTSTIVAANCSPEVPGNPIAANVAAASSGWFLPSSGELNELYLQSTGVGGVVGGFAAGLYWSSSENTAATAWLQDFTNGSQQSGNGKQNAINVRAIRAF